MNRERLSIFSRLMCVLYLVWSAGLIVVCGVMLHATIFTLFWSVGGAIVSLAGVCIGAQNAVRSLRLRFGRCGSLRPVKRAVWMGIGASLAPAIARLMMPLDHPETGVGSPLASLITVFVLAVLGGGFALVTGLIGLAWLDSLDGESEVLGDQP